jgi:hypothetical protein
LLRGAAAGGSSISGRFIVKFDPPSVVSVRPKVAAEVTTLGLRDSPSFSLNTSLLQETVDDLFSGYLSG